MNAAMWLSAARRALLDDLYARYNRREMTAKDPVRFLHDYPKLQDREIVGLIASSLALGNVRQIVESVESVHCRIKPSPAAFLERTSGTQLEKTFAGFKHRFLTGRELAWMLMGVKCVVEKWGSLRGCFHAGLRAEDETILPALSAFLKELSAAHGGQPNRLLPPPEKGSACKRLNLFLRWMVRHDNVDPGGWVDVPQAKLIMPLDTHIPRICRALDMTKRKQANLRTALEITAAFRRIVPEDPVRYDFALAHLGIDGGENLNLFLKRWGTPEVSRAV